MSKDIKTLLKEATKDLLSDETLNSINEAFEQKVNEKVSLAVEAALVQQDEEYSSKLETVLEAIDQDHTTKLEKIVKRIDEAHSLKFEHALKTLDVTHTNKLKKLIKMYESAVNNEAEVFKKALVENLSTYLDLYLDKVIPTEQIKEAVQNARSRKIVESVKRLVGLDETFVNESIREALVDGKSQIDEANAKNKELQKQLDILNEKVNQAERDLLLEKKVSELPSDKKNYVKRVLANKDVDFITENFDYVLEMHDKKETEEVAVLKENTRPKSAGVDRLVVEDVKQETFSSSSADDVDGGFEYVTESYVDLMKNKLA